MESRIRSELSTGNFVRKFVNEDGTYTEDAASFLFPISFGSEYTASWKNMGREEAEKTVQEVIDRGGKPREFNRSGPVLTEKAPALHKFGEERRNPYQYDKTAR